MIQPFNSGTFLHENVRKRNIITEVQSAAGRGFAVPFRNPGISNRLRRCLKAKPCEEQLTSFRQSPHTAYQQLLIPIRYSVRFLQSHSSILSPPLTVSSNSSTSSTASCVLQSKNARIKWAQAQTARLEDFHLLNSSSAAPVLLSRCLFTNFRLKYPRKQALFRDTFGDEDDAGQVTAKGINKT